MYDIIVIGAGIEGLSAANNQKTLLLDQFTIPNELGSSKGQTRGIRHTYDKLWYGLMIPESLNKWLDLESEYGEKLFVNTGILTICSSKDKVSNLINNHKKLGLEYEVLNGQESKKRYPGIKCDDNAVCLFEKEAGVLKANLCLLALKNSILKNSGEIRENEQVIAFLPHSETHVTIRTKKQIFETKSVVLACGPWTNILLKPLELKLPIKIVMLEAMCWKAQTGTFYSASEGYPLSCWEENDPLVFSVPSLDQNGFVKVAFHDGIEVSPNNIGAPLTEKQQSNLHRIQTEITQFVKQRYPELIAVPVYKEICFYQMTPDDDFIIDYHPKYKNIVIGAGFSGHGFKMAPVIGELLGDLILNKPTKYPVKPFSLKRFKNSNL